MVHNKHLLFISQWEGSSGNLIQATSLLKPCAGPSPKISNACQALCPHLPHLLFSLLQATGLLAVPSTGTVGCRLRTLHLAALSAGTLCPHTAAHCSLFLLCTFAQMITVRDFSDYLVSNNGPPHPHSFPISSLRFIFLPKIYHYLSYYRCNWLLIICLTQTVWDENI